jgi:uncharacterized protein (TIGR02594 family)
MARAMTDTAWMQIARAELGISEIIGPADNPRIVAYHATTTLQSKDDETPWCSAFVNWCLAQAGIKGTWAANARSWINWGRFEGRKPGAIVVLWRGSPDAATGHVGFVDRIEADKVWILGGNQGDRVSIAPFPLSRVLAFRWPVNDDARS